MEHTRTENSLLRIIKVGIFTTLLTPLVLGPFGINFIEYPKAVFFRSLIEIIFAFYISLILFNKKYLPKKSIILASLLLFYAVMLIASIFGINFYGSFFGDMPRGEGLIMHLHLLIFFIVITSVFSKREEWLSLFKVAVLISGFCSGVALLQQAKIAFFYGMSLPRLSGTMSNPDLFATYIASSIFITFFLFVAEKRRNFKILWAFLIALNCYTLFFSYTRGSWAGFLIGVVFILIFNFYKLSKKNKILISCGFLACLIFASLFFLNINLFKNSSPLLFSRISKITDLNGRSDSWRAAVIAIKEKPVLGWGFESFAFVADEHMNGLGKGIYYDRVHNKILELLVYGGVVGLLAYILIFVAIFYLIFRYAKLWDGYNNRPKIVYASVLSAFFVAGFVQNIPAFDNIGTYILFFLMAGFISNNFPNIASDQKSIQEKSKSLNNKKHKLVSSAKIFVIFIIFSITLWIFYEVNLKPTVAAMYFPNSIVYENADVQRALLGYERGVSMDTIYDSDLRMAFTDKLLSLLQNASADNVKKNIYDDLLKMKPFFNKSIAENSEQPNHAYQFLARIDEIGYLLNHNQGDLNDMEKILQKAISFNPNVSANWQLMGEFKILQNNYNEGEQDIKKSCVLDNCDEATLYKYMGSAYLKRGDVNLTMKNFEKAIDIGYANKKEEAESPETTTSNVNFIDYVAHIYCSVNDINSCQRIYKKGSDIYPEYANFFRQRFKTITTQSSK
ncbi:MAG: O-antigen ligase family protein [Candidatus Staskawiczbacteria bacterium]|nr:O-antigen ligase family protein [Candidatus Staskawiczbacteria bacterium]